MNTLLSGSGEWERINENEMDHVTRKKLKRLFIRSLRVSYIFIYHDEQHNNNANVCFVFFEDTFFICPAIDI